MSFQLEIYPRFSVQDTLGAADATKVLVAGVAGRIIVVTYAKITSLISAAQVVFVGGATGPIRILSLAASFPVNTEARTELQVGIPLAVGDSLVITPASAGPSMHVVVEGFFKNLGPF